MNLLSPNVNQATPQTLADAVRNATHHGHRPAVTAITENGRYEQSYASMAQWVAKGAHLLQSDLMIEPGEKLAICSRLSWHTQAIVLAAWWVGLDVTTNPQGAAVVIVSSPLSHDGLGAHVFSVGDAIDGAPLVPFGVPAWTHGVRLFPDAPPPATCTPQMIALSDKTDRFTHAQLLARVDSEGVMGYDVSQPITADMLFAVAARPMITGHRTVILDGVAPAAAANERVAVWR